MSINCPSFISIFSESYCSSFLSSSQLSVISVIFWCSSKYFLLLAIRLSSFRKSYGVDRFRFTFELIFYFEWRVLWLERFWSFEFEKPEFEPIFCWIWVYESNWDFKQFFEVVGDFFIIWLWDYCSFKTAPEKLFLIFKSCPFISVIKNDFLWVFDVRKWGFGTGSLKIYSFDVFYLSVVLDNDF